jgi:hypothetical protein
VPQELMAGSLALDSLSQMWNKNKGYLMGKVLPSNGCSTGKALAGTGGSSYTGPDSSARPLKVYLRGFERLLLVAGWGEARQESYSTC